MTKLAIIGTGIAGLGCAHFLHANHEVTLYEQNDYVGGHTNTITVDEAGAAVPIDTGFMVYNEVTYPNLTRLFNELDVATKPTSMSFSVQHKPTGLEYNGTSFTTLFGQRRNLVNPRFWQMLTKIQRFNRDALAALNDPRYADFTLRQYVEEKGYGADFLNFYLIPMGSAVWSTPPALMLDFPAMTLIRFWHNHGFLGMYSQHPWRTVMNGSQSYVAKLTAPFRDRISVHRKAVKIFRENGSVTVVAFDGSTEVFDKVILACHADQALALIASPTSLERKLLSEFRYQPNTATLHTDPQFMPKTRRCWASWNYRIDQAANGELLPTTHYWMNSLQSVSNRENYFVSLNAHDRVDPARVLRRIEYEHPIFSMGAISAQRELPALNQVAENQGVYFCGSYFKYGFHEDAFTSALELCRIIRKEPIWN